MTRGLDRERERERERESECACTDRDGLTSYCEWQCAEGDRCRGRGGRLGCEAVVRVWEWEVGKKGRLAVVETGSEGVRVPVVKGGSVPVVMGGSVPVVMGGKVSVVRGRKVSVVRGGKVSVVRGGKVLIVRGGKVLIVRGGKVQVVKGGRVRGGKVVPVLVVKSLLFVRGCRHAYTGSTL